MAKEKDKDKGKESKKKKPKKEKRGKSSKKAGIMPDTPEFARLPTTDQIATYEKLLEPILREYRATLQPHEQPSAADRAMNPPSKRQSPESPDSQTPGSHRFPRRPRRPYSDGSGGSRGGDRGGGVREPKDPIPSQDEGGAEVPIPTAKPETVSTGTPQRIPARRG